MVTVLLNGEELTAAASVGVRDGEIADLFFYFRCLGNGAYYSTLFDCICVATANGLCIIS